jgi:carboxypeptidase family protein
MTMRRRSLLTLAILGLAGCGGGGNGINVISGTVRAQGLDGPGVAGVTVVLQNVSPKNVFANPILLSFSTTTDHDGHFSFRTQPGTYRLRALLDGYVFSPPELNFTLDPVDLDGQDFMATKL